MTTAQPDAARKWHTVYCWVVAARGFLSFILWLAFCLLWWIAGNISVGDGTASSQPSPDEWVIYLPLCYLIMAAASALPFVPRQPLVIASVFGQVFLAVSIYFIVHAPLAPVMI